MPDVRGTTVETPEGDKMLAAKDKGWVGVGGLLPEFYDFLKAKGIVLAAYGERDRLWPHRYDADPNQLIADFLGIDLQAMDDEKRAILRALGNTSV